MSNKFVPFAPPAISELEISEVVDTLRSDWLTTGPKVKTFEQDFSSFLGQKNAVAFNSWTGAAHTALACLGLKPGDEVIVPTITFAASANIVEHVGATPVIVDVCPDTLCMDPSKVKSAITARTRGLLPVHYAGHPADMSELNSLAKEHGLFVLEDAAHSLPSKINSRLIGAGDNLVAFSFYATKNLTTGEGGMLVGPQEILERARTVGLHGMSRDAWNRYDEGGSWMYDIEMPGFKYNMTDIAAALGIHQLKRLDTFHSRRKEIVSRYIEGLADVCGILLPAEKSGFESSWHLFVIRIDKKDFGMHRNDFIQRMGEAGIGTSVHFIPLHRHSFYRNKYHLHPELFPVAETAFDQIVSLPLSARHTDEDVERVIRTVKQLAS